MGTLQISTSHNFANTGPIKNIQNVLKSEWWDLSAYEISLILLTIRYIALDHLTRNDPAAIHHVSTAVHPPVT